MGGIGGKWQKMEENGARLGGIGEISGIAHEMWVVEGCGGMRLRKMGQKWEKNGTKYPFFTVPPFPFFQRSKIFSTAPFVKISSTWEFSRTQRIFATHAHSPPQRLVRMLASVVETSDSFTNVSLAQQYTAICAIAVQLSTRAPSETLIDTCTCHSGMKHESNKRATTQCACSCCSKFTFDWNDAPGISGHVACGSH